MCRCCCREVRRLFVRSSGRGGRLWQILGRLRGRGELTGASARFINSPNMQRGRKQSVRTAARRTKGPLRLRLALLADALKRFPQWKQHFYSREITQTQQNWTPAAELKGLAQGNTIINTQIQILFNLNSFLARLVVMWQTKGRTSLDHKFSLINETLQSNIVVLCGLHDRDQCRSALSTLSNTD